MLNLHTSNRLEELALRLADVIAVPLGSPLRPEIVLVQSQGMARWLSLQLAERHGICSNCQFPFPRALSYSVFHAAIPNLKPQPAYDADVLVWQVMKQLPQLLDVPGFELVRNYIGPATDDRKRFQLAQQIARVLDQYLVFRPELVLDWENGKAADWQAKLWREVSEPFRQEHPAALQARLIHALNQQQPCLSGLPERLAVFGISALPPFYLTILAALGRHFPVHLFLLEPCREFWGYIRSANEQELNLKKAGRGPDEADALHLEKGNRLLASMGKLGRDFLLLVQDAGEWHESEPGLFHDPGETTLLATIQSDILNLRDRGQPELPRSAVLAEDDSIRVHSCHSPLRELEVLQDHLLAWFEQDRTLAPRDILVMIPEIEAYAPFVHAVFDSPESEALRIPFSVADRAPRTQSHLIQTFLSILNLAGSRLGAATVLALLESAPLRQKFDLAESDLEVIRHWIDHVRIRWGQNQTQRAALGLPAWNENSWQDGLQRLLVGYAMAGKGARAFRGILPFDDIEGDTAELLGRFLEFTNQLFQTVRDLSTERTLDQWAGTCQSILATFFTPSDGHAAELQALHSCLEKLRSCGQRAKFEETIPWSVVLEELNRDLSEDRFGAGYLTGGVTFCALKPMRSIPAKIICLLGLNNGAFPRSAAPLSFDLMSVDRQLGDRSSREDDRYLFLETLISARQRLYLSYVGQSIRDNSVAPPSVVISELLDYIAQGFELPGHDIIEDQILVRHRLQAFSPSYFSGGQLFSYSRENLQASQATQPAPAEPAPFLAAHLPEPEPEWRRLSLPSLTEFLRAPARFLARKRLRINLPLRSASVEEREPFTLEGLDRYSLETELLELKLSGADLVASKDLIRGSGRLPASQAGEASYAQLCRNVDTFWKRLQPHLPDQFEPSETFELLLDGFTVSGHFSRMTPTGMLFYRPATIKAPDLLRAWVEHLLWSAVQADPERAQSTLVGTDTTWTLQPVPDAKAVLAQVLACYWTGLSHPLKFFPKTSFAFAEADLKAAQGKAGRAKTTPQECARAAWEGDDFRGQAGESEDEYISLFFRDHPPLDEEFEQIARTVFHPLLEHAQAAP